MVSINVVCALFISLAFDIHCTKGCSCVERKFFVNEGACVFKVRSYGKFSLSKTLAMDLAAHICVSIPVSFSTFDWSSFSSHANCFFIA